jgi:2-polyprenyl-3-methyl-5-hydroxy-6-metoxy-1,4-benzoquinol methylase
MADEDIILQEIRRQEVSCNLCHNHESEYLFSVRSFNVVRCPDCGLAYLNPMPYPDDAAGIYNKDYYRSRDAGEGLPLGYPDYLELQDHHTFVADELLRPLRDIQPGTVLDVGCGMGTMLKRFCELGWDAYGIDVSTYATDYARDELGLNVFTGTVEESDLPESFFDLITLVHVIEHLPDPRRTLETLHGLLKSGGVLIVATHDMSGLWPQIVGKRWRHLNIPEHLYFFSKKNLVHMLENTGFHTFRFTETATLAAVTSETGLYAPIRLLYHLGLIKQVAPLLRGWHTIARKLNISDGLTTYSRRV